MDERARSSEYVCTTQAKVFTLSFAVVWAFPQLVGLSRLHLTVLDIVVDVPKILPPCILTLLSLSPSLPPS